MDAIECILTRRSIRKFLDKEVEQEKIEKIIECGKFAPSALNRQTYHFTVIKNKEWLSDVSKFFKKRRLNPLYNVTYGAPILIVVSDSDIRFAEKNASAAIENIMLAAHALGLGTCRINQLSDDDLKDDKEFVNFIEKAGIDIKSKIVGSVALGYSSEKDTAAKPRKNNNVNFY